jgi:hypothetical protein
MLRFLKRLLAARGKIIPTNSAAMGDDDDIVMHGPTINWNDERDPIRRYVLNPTGKTPPPPRSVTERDMYRRG